MEWPFYCDISNNIGAVTIRGQARNEFKVNGQRLKHYFGGNVNED